MDMVDAMNLSPEAIQERIAFLRDKIQKEQKVRRRLGRAATPGHASPGAC